MSTPLGHAEVLKRIFETEIQTPIPLSLVEGIITQAPFVSVPEIFNVRDVSNVNYTFASTFPPIVRPGLIYRAGAPPTTLSDEGKEALTSLGIAKIYDLRRGLERANKPSPKIDGVEMVWVPYAFEEPPPDAESFGRVNGAVDAFTKMYLRYLDTHVPIYKLVFEHIRDDPQKPLLFHCSAGKDRTGVLAALILRLAGSSDDAIVHDYMLSRAGIEPAREGLVALAKAHHGDSVTKNPQMTALFGVQVGGMVGFLETLDETYGGVTGYLKTRMGFSDKDLEIMRDNLRMTKGHM